MAEKLAMPPTVTVPLSVIFPELAVALKLPPILEFPSCTAETLVIVALPVPVVFRLISPIASKVSKAISASEVTKVALPSTVTEALSVILPVIAVAVKSPPILLVPKLN